MLIPPTWTLPEAIKERLGQKVGRQRAMEADGHLLLILHKPPAPDAREREGALFWRNPAGQWQSTSRGEGLSTLRKHLEDYGERVDQLEKRLEVAEGADNLFAVLQAIAPLHRATRNMQQALQDAREAIPQARELIVLRDRAYDIDRTADLLQIEARDAVDYSIAKRAEEQARSGMELARSGHRLNVLAAIFLPLTAVASVFGMNLYSGLENRPAWVFWAVLALGVAVGFWVRAALEQGERVKGTRTDPPREVAKK